MGESWQPSHKTPSDPGSTHSSSSRTHTIKKMLHFLSRLLLLHSTRHRRSNSQTSIVYADGKYTWVSKGKIHQSFTHVYLQVNRACNIMLPLFSFICSGLGVFLRYFHRLFKLSVVLRLNRLL